MLPAANPISLYMAFGGAALAILGLVLLVRRIGLLTSGRRVVGEVVGWGRDTMGDPPTDAFMPRVKFVTAEGVAQEFQSTVSANPDRWPIGTAVPVLYPPERPKDAQIAIAWRFWAGPVGVLTFASLLLVFAWRIAG
jgi:hypothetical protein